jgi:hypothetical protein
LSARVHLSLDICTRKRVSERASEHGPGVEVSCASCLPEYKRQTRLHKLCQTEFRQRDSLFNIYHFTTLTRRRLLHFSGLSRRTHAYFYFFSDAHRADDNSTMNPHLITLKFSLSADPASFVIFRGKIIGLKMGRLLVIHRNNFSSGCISFQILG